MQHEHDPTHKESTAQAPAAGGPLESLMAEGKKPDPAQAKGHGKPDLGAEALAAAQAARAPEPGHAATAHHGAAHGHEPPVGKPSTAAPAPRREWVLRALLVLNIALIGVTLGLPMGGSKPQPGSKLQPSGGDHGEPGHGASTRKATFAIDDQTLYLRALELAADGKYDDAIAVLEGFLKANPELAEVEHRLTLQALATFASRAGRPADASRYEAAIDRLRVGAQLPQDLLDLAKQAEADGRGGDMRRYYARFLLMQKQLSPSLRERIAEAYLKLGDGYRVEAEQGAARELERKRAADNVAPLGETAPKAEPKTEPHKAETGHKDHE